VRIWKLFRERAELFSRLNFVPPGTKLPEQPDGFHAFFSGELALANEPSEGTTRLERRSPPHDDALELA
jgi:hypothetical protein